MSMVTRRYVLKSGAVCLAGYALFGGMVEHVSASVLGDGADDQSLQIIHITDSHLDLAKPETATWLQLFVDKVNNEYASTDFVLFGGDNFNNNVVGKDDAVQFKSIADGLKCPWYAVRGNKEASPKPKGDSLNQADFAGMFFTGKLEVHGRNWKVSKGGYTILGLDSTVDAHNNGLYSPKTLDFVENELRENPNSHYILVNHHAYVNYWQGSDPKDIHKYVLNNEDEVKQRLFRYQNLKLTLSGHKHLNDSSKIGETRVVSTVGFKVPQGAHKDHQFRVVKMKDGNVVQEQVVGIV